MPIVGLLGLLFIGLKMTGFIAWSWVWVLAPFWAGAALAVCLVGLALIGFGGAAGVLALSGVRRKPRR